jgi:hypothetical protein
MNFRLFGKEKRWDRVGLMVDLTVHGSISAPDSEHEAEHLQDAPQNQSHCREDGVRHSVEQHEEETKYHHSTFDFTIQLQTSTEARFYLQNYKKNLRYATFRASFFFPFSPFSGRCCIYSRNHFHVSPEFLKFARKMSVPVLSDGSGHNTGSIGYIS